MAPSYESDEAMMAPLREWMHTLISFVQSDQPDLTNRQMAILLIVYLMDGPHTVRGLAAKLKVSKPVVTRALNTLGAIGYVRRQKDESDLRNIFVERTEQGQAFLREYAERITNSRTHANQPREASSGQSFRPTLE